MLSPSASSTRALRAFITIVLARGLTEMPLAAQTTPAAPDGAALFTQHCTICHIAAGVGQDFGPNLSDAGLRLTRDAIRQSILTPSQTITEGYAQVEVTRENGQILVGILGPESGGTVIVKQLAGVLHRIPKDEVRSQKILPVSAMESAQKLSPVEVEAVTDYVLTLKQPVARKAPPVAPEFKSRGAPRWLLLFAGGFALVLGAIALRGRKATPTT